MFAKTTKWMAPGILLGVILGAWLGMVVPNVFEVFGFIGDLYLNTLVFALIPLIVISVVYRLYNMGTRQKLSRVTGKTLAYFGALAVVAVLIGLVAGFLFRPSHTGMDFLSDIYSDWAPYTPIELSSWLITGLILFGLLAGGALTMFGNRVKGLANILRQADQGVLKVIGFLAVLAPVGLFVETGAIVARDDSLRMSMHDIVTGVPAESPVWWESIIGDAGLYILASFLGLVVLGGIALLIARSLGKTSLFSLFKAAAPGMTASLSASSSLSAAPLTYAGLTETAQIDDRAAAAVIPLGPLLNVAATALCSVIALVFISRIGNLEVSFGQYILIAVLPILLAVGRPGLPYPMLGIVTAVVAVLGLGERAMAALPAVLLSEWLVDRLRSGVTVWSDAVGAAVIAETFEFKTARGVRTQAAKEPVRQGRKRPERSAPDRRRGERRSRDSRPQRRTRTSDKRSADPKSARSEKTTRAGDKNDNSPFQMSVSTTPTFGVDTSEAQENEKARSAHAGEQKTIPDSEKAPEEREQRRRQTSSRSSAGRTRRESPGRAARQEPSAEESENGAASGRLSPETIARELQKVSSQLQSYPEVEEEETPSEKPEERAEHAEDGELKAAETEEEAESASNDTEPETDRRDEHVKEREAREPSSEPEDAEDEEATPGAEDEEEAESEEESITYGRSRTRVSEKRPEPEADDASGEESEELPEPRGSFSKESVTSFGRSKRRKPRF
jgi:Na+/H+-dicarboxylate symporter